MAYRRFITARTKQLCEHQRFAPSFSYINHDNQTNQTNNQNVPSSTIYNLTPTRGFRTFNASNFHFQRQRFAPPFNSPVYGSLFSRNMSTGVEKSELITDMDAFVDGTFAAVTDQMAPVLNEVAVAAADSYFPVAALQFVIEYVHVTTGLNWWAAIAVTTVVIRCLLIPLTVFQLKASTKFAILRPQMEEVNQEMQDRGMTADAVSEGKAKMQALYKEHKVTPFTPMKGILVTAPVFICFFLAIQNMAEKVPSFQQGGAYWFLDLTTPDEMYIFPVLMALTFWITVEFNMQEGMEGNSTSKTMKNVSRGFAALAIPLTASFSKAIFCYWITANLFSLMYGMVVKKPAVKKFLGVPIIPKTTLSSKETSFFDTIKKIRSAAKQNVEAHYAQQDGVKGLAETLKNINQIMPSPTILSQSQRITSLEKQVKGKKKGGKKRR